MRKILLIGILGTYNYGCEAIVRGTANQIKLQYPDAELTYASLRLNDDTKRLTGSGVKIINLEIKQNRYAPENIIRKIFEKAGITVNYTVFAHIPQLIKSYDAVISIGGDIYTLMPNGGYSTDISHIGNLCYKYSIPYVIWGCSIGPFSKNPKAEKYYTNHLRKVTKIVAREQVTIDYLASIGVIDNVVFAPDPAFYVLPMEQRRCISIDKVKKIGINLSPHSAQYHYACIEEAIELQAQEISKLIKRLNCRIVLLPHVISPVFEDNDFDYLEQIKLKIADNSNVSIIENDPGFIGLKNIIKECDVVISARMHCNINAVTCGVPTLFLAYSQKAQGMIDFVYKDKSLLMNIREFNVETLIEKMNKLLVNTYDVKDWINNYDIKKNVQGIFK